MAEEVQVTVETEPSPEATENQEQAQDLVAQAAVQATTAAVESARVVGALETQLQVLQQNLSEVLAQLATLSGKLDQLLLEEQQTQALVEQATEEVEEAVENNEEAENNEEGVVEIVVAENSNSEPPPRRPRSLLARMFLGE